MINLFNTQIEQLFIHKVGNKSRNEAIFLSEEALKLTDEITPLFNIPKKLQHINFTIK